MKQTTKTGFTLLEILVSLFILTIIGVLITTAMAVMVRAQDKIEIKNHTLIDTQFAISMLERDLHQIINRSILQENKTLPAILVTDSSIEFTRGGFVNPFANYQRSELQRIRYQLIANNLIRFTWPVLDRLMSTPVNSEIILTNVRFFRVRILPLPQNNPLTNLAFKPTNFNMNIGVAIELEVQNLGYIQRLIVLATNDFVRKENATPKTAT